MGKIIGKIISKWFKVNYLSSESTQPQTPVTSEMIIRIFIILGIVILIFCLINYFDNKKNK